MAARIRAWLAREDGMTIPELLTAMAILAFVLSGVLAVYVGGLRATTDMNERFQAQQNARLALTSMRSDTRSACSESVPAGGMSVTFSEPNVTTGCSSGTTQVTWCVSSSTGNAPFGLYRQSGASCSWSTGVKKAGQLTTKNGTVTVFVPVAVASTKPQLSVTLPVDANLANSQGVYTLADTMTLRNTSYALSVSKAGVGSGTVSSSPSGIACGSTCSQAYAFGTQVTMSAAANSGSTFAGWSGGGCSGTGLCTVTMNAAQSVTATFTSP
jgi:prepilin-type N-terminal cleavage/methylation domain-containing protein